MLISLFLPDIHLTEDTHSLNPELTATYVKRYVYHNVGLRKPTHWVFCCCIRVNASRWNEPWPAR